MPAKSHTTAAISFLAVAVSPPFSKTFLSRVFLKFSKMQR